MQVGILMTGSQTESQMLDVQPRLLKEGKTFKGWKPEVTAAVADASYTAVYEETTPGGTGAVYTVTFDADNGTEVTAYKVAAGKTVEEPKEKPVKEGFTFKGWFKVPDPATAQTTPAAGAETGQEETLYDFTAPVNSDLKLKAHWEANALTLADVSSMVPRKNSFFSGLAYTACSET